MRHLLGGATALSIMVGAQGALAFEACDRPVDPANLGRVWADQAAADSPVRYYELAHSIRLNTAYGGDRLMPAGGEELQTKYILFTPLFAKVVCKIALSTYLYVENVQPDVIDQAAQTAARCLDAGGTQKTCLIAFADELDERYSAAFASLPSDHAAVALTIYEATLQQIMMHEYAHHFLGHFGPRQISEIDAEFAADLFAITNGVQRGEPPSAMDYFFGAIADIESYTKAPKSADYESAACRSNNVENITAYLGIAPLMLVDAAMGGHGYLSNTSPSMVRAQLDKLFAAAPPSLAPGSCGRIAQVALPEMREELRQLYLRMEPDLDFLFSTDQNPDVARARSLLRDWLEMSKNLHYTNGIVAKCIVLMLRGWGLKGRDLAPLVNEVDRSLTTPTVTDYFLSEDFGRLLQARGLVVLQEGTNLPVQSRLDQSFSLFERAVAYNPAQTEAWMNLAIVAFKRGDCAAASRFGERAIETNTDKEQLKDTQFFATAMKEYSGDPKTCIEAAARFHPYDGL